MHPYSVDNWEGYEPDLPYAGTSGHSGGDTSRERAVHADSDGTTGHRQQVVLRQLAVSHHNHLGVGGTNGITWKELSQITGWHHGQASGVLSNLHKVGKIARLTIRRDRCFVYVLPEFVGERETQSHGNPRKAAILTPLEQAQMAGARDSLAMGSGAVVPGWRMNQMLDIIERLTA